MYQRHLQQRLMDALSDTPVVFLQGPRQAGKSTLVQALLTSGHPARYVTLDDPVPLAASQADPDAFLSGFEGPVALDEVQRSPGLYRALKAAVDRDRRPGRFLLTGSAQALLLPRLAEMLAGRMEVVTLYPLSQTEIEGRRVDWIGQLFGDGALRSQGGCEGLYPRVAGGGFPEVLTRPQRARQGAWYDSYISTILQRDVLEMSRVEDLGLLPRLLRLIAARSGSLLNASEMSRALAAPLSTLKRHLALFEATFLVQTVPAWSSNKGKRLVKAPKIYLSDTGLLAHLLGWDASHDPLARETGMLLENFVAMELRKHMGWSSIPTTLHHYRTFSGREVDFALEGPGGKLVGIEVKASTRVGPEDFKGLRDLADDAGKRWHRGVVLHAGKETVSFGKGYEAAPLSVFWK